MAKHRNIEEKMKAVASAEHTTPPPFVWENVTAELDKDTEPKRRFFFLIWGSAFAAIALMGYIIMSSGSIENIEQESLSSIEMGTSLKNGDTQNTANAEELTTAPNENFKETKEPKSTLQSSEKSSSNEQSDKTTAPQKKLIKSKSTASSFSSEFNTKSKKPNETVTSIKQSISRQNILTPNKTNENSATKLETAAKTSSTNRALYNIDLLSEKLQELAMETRKIDGLKSVECPTFTKKKNIPKPFLELSGILGSHSKSIEQGLGSQVLLDNREATEKSWLGYGAQLTIGWYLNSNFYLVSGVEVSRATDKFDQSREGLTKMIIDFDLESGDPVDTSFVVGNIVNSGIVKYDMLEVPLILGYRQLIGKWSLGLEAVALLNLKFAASGKIATANGTISTIADEGSVYKSNIGLGLKSSLVMGRYISHGVSLQSRVTYKSYLSDINETTYELPTQMQFWRLELGIRKEF